MAIPVAYCRISSDKTGAGLGVERQAEDCRELAARLGLSEPQVLTDNDLSAYSGKPRPGYDELKAGLRDGRWSDLLIWHVDRLCRNPRDLEDVVDLVNGRVAVHTVKGGEIDLETPEGRMQARMLGTLARYESEHRADRVRREVRQRAERGREHGGPLAYGWNSDGTLNPEEAAIVAELTRRVIAGESGAALAADLERRGVPSSRGAKWRNTAIRKILLRGRNAGLREYHGEIVAEEFCVPIVSRDDWEAAKAVLTNPARTTRPGKPVARLLSGLMTCAVCGGPVTSGGARHGYGTYECAARKHVRRHAAHLDDHVQAAVLVYLADVEQIPIHTSSGRPDGQSRLKTLRTLLENLEDKRAFEEISRTAYLRNRNRLREQITDLERSEVLNRLPGPLAGVTVDGWSNLPLERKRAVIKHLFKITIQPTTKRRFDETAIEITPNF